MTSVESKEDLVTVTIDGMEISVPPGTLLIRAAEQLGISIPRFCDHPLLEPAGACRQCLVEVTDMGNGRGMPKPAASCTTTVMPGMVIATQHTSPVADKAQHGVMELLLINHPLDCPVCDKGGECPLQNQAMSNGRAASRFVETKRTFPKPVAVNASVLLDRERCVLCQRCTRFSEQIAGDPFIALVQRGAQQQIGTSSDQPFQSYFSGNTVQICPVGALTGAAYRFRARPFDLRSADSVCEHCAAGCAQRSDFRRGVITRRQAGDDPRVNEEWNCDKGRWAFGYATADDRLSTPLVRGADGTLAPATWPQALEAAATGLRAAGGKVGVLPGGRLSTEDAVAYGAFARQVLGTEDIDFRSRPLSAEEAAFLRARVAGTSPEQVSYASLAAAPAVLLVGFEPEEEAPIVFLRLRKATRAGRTAVWSVAPLASRGLAKLNGTVLTALPGGEAAVVAAVPEQVRAALSQPGAVILAGERLATSPGALRAVAQLADATGATLAWIPRRAGERGALDAGLLPQAGGRDADGIWIAAAAGHLKALLVGGVDPADASDPAKALAALAAAEFVVSLEVRASAVTEHADVVLPVAPPAEKAGCFVNWEGRHRPFEATLATTALSDHQVLDALAEELGVHLGLRTAAQCRAAFHARADALAAPAPWPAEAPASAPAAPAAAAGQDGAVLLATWPELLDAGRGQDGADSLAATAKPARALLSPATAAAAGLGDAATVTVTGERGAFTLPLQVQEMADGVVWVPSNARGYPVRSGLAAGSGSSVTISAGGVA